MLKGVKEHQDVKKGGDKKTVVKRKFPEKEEKIKEINEEPFDFFCRKVYICVLL
jgi:hypothetical protein